MLTYAVDHGDGLCDGEDDFPLDDDHDHDGVLDGCGDPAWLTNLLRGANVVGSL